jgi:transposase
MKLLPYTGANARSFCATENSQPAHADLIPNIKENPRNRKTPKRGRKRLFNEAIHALRMRVERTFAWEDKFKRLLLRFERIQQRHYGMKLLAYTLINLRKFCGT